MSTVGAYRRIPPGPYRSLHRSPRPKGSLVGREGDRERWKKRTPFSSLSLAPT